MTSAMIWSFLPTDSAASLQDVFFSNVFASDYLYVV